MKTCSICEKEKLEEEFPKHRTYCIPCRNAKTRAKYALNREQAIARVKKYKKENPEVVKRIKRNSHRKHRESILEKQKVYREKKGREYFKESLQKWRDNNPEKVKAASKVEWNRRVKRELEKNPAFYNIRASARRAKILQATPKWLTVEQHREIEAIYKSAKTLAIFHEEKYDVDHIEPLKGKTSCGLHAPWNLRAIPATENARKYNKLIPTT